MEFPDDILAAFGSWLGLKSRARYNLAIDRCDSSLKTRYQECERVAYKFYYLFGRDSSPQRVLDKLPELTTPDYVREIPSNNLEDIKRNNDAIKIYNLYFKALHAFFGKSGTRVKVDSYSCAKIVKAMEIAEIRFVWDKAPVTELLQEYGRRPGILDSILCMTLRQRQEIKTLDIPPQAIFEYLVDQQPEEFSRSIVEMIFSEKNVEGLKEAGLFFTPTILSYIFSNRLLLRNHMYRDIIDDREGVKIANEPENILRIEKNIDWSRVNRQVLEKINLQPYHHILYCDKECAKYYIFEKMAPGQVFLYDGNLRKAFVIILRHLIGKKVDKDCITYYSCFDTFCTCDYLVNLPPLEESDPRRERLEKVLNDYTCGKN